MKTISLFRSRAVSRYIFIFLMTLYSVASAQQTPSTNNQTLITGTVFDSAGAIMDASVSIAGSYVHVFTDENGAYSISATATDILVFSYPGYNQVEVLVGNQLVIDVELSGSVALEEAVINAGYYTVKDRERTGSISRVVAADIENQPVGNVLSAVQGRMAGVSIVQNSGVPGGGFQVQIRGVNSLRREGNHPLYIIDGVPISAQSPSSFSSAILPYADINPLNSINSNDIESIEVLKDADATAIYGSRGANGVVLVTTKKGKFSKTSFSVNTSYSFSTVANSMKMLNTAQYLNMRNSAFLNDGVDIPANAYDLNGAWDLERDTDWQKQLIGKTATGSAVEFSINGGGETTRYMFSGSHKEQQTVFSDDFLYKTNNLSATMNHRSKDKKFELNATGLFSSQTNNIINEDLTKNALRLAPNAPSLYDEYGNLNWENNTFNNPVAAFNGSYGYESKTINSSLNLSYELLPSFLLKANAGINYLSFQETSLRPHTIYDPAWEMTSASSTAVKGNNQNFSYLIEPQINYRKNFNAHEVDVLIGGTFQQSENASLGAYGSGFESNTMITNLAAASDVTILHDEKTQYNYAALFGRINYQFNNKYILNLTARRDGSSRFGPNNRFANFGAVGAAWVFSEENFIKDVSWLSFAKFRGSYGITGSDLIGNYQYLNSYSINSTIYGGITTLSPARLYNPDFSWEKTHKLEAAIDFGFLNNRVNFTAAWYRNRSGNQLVGIPLPGTTGFSTIQANLPATVENKGWEFEFSTHPVKGKSLNWETSLNLSIPENKLISFPGLEGSTYANSYVVGMPTHIVKVYNYEGIDPQTGLYGFTDYNGDGRITSPDDNQNIQRLGVRFSGGWNNRIQYNRWNLSFLFQFVKQRNWNYNNQMMIPGSMNNQPVEVFDVWSADNPNGQYMPYSTGFDPAKEEVHFQYMASSAAISDASYIRLKNIQLSYRLPLNFFLEDAHIYFQAQNLLTFTDYFGLDPEFIATGYLPPLKSYSLGVQFNF